ncbi:MAG: class I adenylate-forming enzyme family protein [Kineosporiaceae bacterium]
MVEVLAAQAAGEVPVVAPPETSADIGEALVSAAAAETVRHGLDLDEPLLVVVTSGSSGRPRAVVRTAESWAASLTGYTSLSRQTSADLAWTPGGGASTLTLFALWHALATGVPALATGRWRGVAGIGVAGAGVAGAGARRSEVTVVHTVPAAAADVLAARRAGALPALRRVVVAGAAVPGELRAAAAAAGVELAEYYGAAELSFVAADADGGGLRAFPGAEVRVRDGRVQVRSPYLALGYLGGAAGPLTVDAEGWAGVGDLGRMGPDGVLVVAGRGEDAISVGGHVVIAADVEAVLGRVPGVAEVVCLGVPHDRLGERVVAVVRTRPGQDWPEVQARVRAAARDELPEPARPVRLMQCSELPTTESGKVARAVVRAQLLGGGRERGRAAAAPA